MTSLVTKPILLVVDDTPDNIQIIHGILSDQYTIRAATSGEKALKLASTHPLPELILLDVMMPEMDGFETCRRLKRDPVTSKIPVVFVTAKTDTIDEQTGFELGAVDYISKPISPAVLKVRTQTHLALSNQARQLEALVQQRTQELESTRHKIIQKLGLAAEYRDNETGLHISRMSHYGRILAEQVCDSQAWCEMYFTALPMHDIGKIGIPDSILSKPGKLTDDERQQMQQHTSFGAQILDDENDPLLSLAQEIALYHHERWDGTGYPHRLAGEQIPLSARIAAIADVFDALTSDRPYKVAWSTQKAFDYIEENAGTQFDPKLTRAFIECKAQVLEVQQRFAEPKTTTVVA
ncbi:HD domain-containing phosphohydrolase [Shewanella sp. GD04112]|uniref:HD-GYP domain-containing protein n=1 Tax=Shewanella sp. GD04112 TaxID=2975434 RepID=UPI002448F00A|nr:HD domain-containing phosphohydrolase [Shewanella sp. GD04112]MDH0447091.1 response regulator [Shewanella sp. GD04112]